MRRVETLRAGHKKWGRDRLDAIDLSADGSRLDLLRTLPAKARRLLRRMLRRPMAINARRDACGGLIGATRMEHAIGAEDAVSRTHALALWGARGS